MLPAPDRPQPSPVRQGDGKDPSASASQGETLPGSCIDLDPEDHDVVVEDTPDQKTKLVDKHPDELAVPKIEDVPTSDQHSEAPTEYFGPESDGLDMSEVPDMDNMDAPRFEKHEHHLTPNAIRCRSRRIFTPRVDGSKKVSETILKEWHGRGQPRKDLETIFKQCGYNPESLHYIICFFVL